MELLSVYKELTMKIHFIFFIRQRIKALSRPTQDWGPGLFQTQKPSREHKLSFGEFPLDDSMRPLKSLDDTTVNGMEVKQQNGGGKNCQNG